MPWLNSVTLMGNLAADVEMRRLPSGDAVATFTLGINSGRSADGKARRGEFFTCSTWGGWAENLAKTAKKGSLVIVEGRLAQDRWVDQRTNEPRSRVKIRAGRVFHVTAQYGEIRAEGEAYAPEEREGQDLEASRIFEEEEGDPIPPARSRETG